MPSVIIDHRKQQLDLFGPPPGPMPVINPDGVSIKGCRTISQATDWRSFTLRMIDLFNRLGACDLQQFLPPGYPNPMRVPQHHRGAR
jgi:hypothetical protein